LGRQFKESKIRIIKSFIHSLLVFDDTVNSVLLCASYYYALGFLLYLGEKPCVDALCAPFEREVYDEGLKTFSGNDKGHTEKVNELNSILSEIPSNYHCQAHLTTSATNQVVIRDSSYLDDVEITERGDYISVATSCDPTCRKKITIAGEGSDVDEDITASLLCANLVAGHTSSEKYMTRYAKVCEALSPDQISSIES
jgi:hypothetical protein